MYGLAVAVVYRITPRSFIWSGGFSSESRSLKNRLCNSDNHHGNLMFFAIMHNLHYKINRDYEVLHFIRLVPAVREADSENYARPGHLHLWGLQLSSRISPGLSCSSI